MKICQDGCGAHELIGQAHLGLWGVGGVVTQEDLLPVLLLLGGDDSRQDCANFVRDLNQK